MCLLLESLRIEHGQIGLPTYHNRRMNAARQVLFGATDALDIRQCVGETELPQDGIYKCRVLYDTAVRSIEYVPYQKRVVRSLQLVAIPTGFNYAWKYANRTGLDALFQQRGHCDDVLLVRNGLLTDTSYSNIALFDGAQWYTPSRPLLRGVRVESLVEQGVLRQADIHQRDIPRFRKAILLNAMLGFEDAVKVDTSCIVAMAQ